MDKKFVSGTLGEDNVVSLLVVQGAVNGFEGSVALVDEQEFVPVSISKVALGSPGQDARTDGHVRVVEQGNEKIVSRPAGKTLGQAVGAQFPLNVRPPHGGVGVVEMGDPSKKAFPSVLFLVQAIGNFDVRLFCVDATLPK